MKLVEVVTRKEGNQSHPIYQLRTVNELDFSFFMTLK